MKKYRVGQCLVFYNRSAKAWEVDHPMDHITVSLKESKEQAINAAKMTKPWDGYDTVYGPTCRNCGSNTQARFFIKHPYATRKSYNMMSPDLPPTALGELIRRNQEQSLFCRGCFEPITLKFQWVMTHD